VLLLLLLLRITIIAIITIIIIILTFWFYIKHNLLPINGSRPQGVSSFVREETNK